MSRDGAVVKKETVRRVFLADDHPLFLRGLAEVLAAQNDLVVVGVATDGHAAVDGIVETGPDVVVVDAHLGPDDAAAVIAGVAARGVVTSYIAACGVDDEPTLRAVVDAGARGVVRKRSSGPVFLDVIRRVAAGERWIAADLPLRREGRRLSDREIAVLRGVALGLTAKEVATALGVSVSTVDTYKARAMDKLQLKSRADVVRHALRHGWLPG